MLPHLRSTSIAIALDGDTDPESRAVVEKAADDAMPTLAECQAWSPAVRRCLAEVATERDVHACERRKQEEQGIDMGGPACDRVAAHMMRVFIEPLGSKDTAHMARIRARFDDACLAMPKTLKLCVLAASTQDEMVRCHQGASSRRTR